MRQHPSKWQPFVAHRVAAVQALVPASRWRYVPTRDNPADLATRGLTPEELRGATKWWNGPDWLAGPPRDWPPDERQDCGAVEERRAAHAVLETSEEENETLLRFSTLSRLLRVTAICFRWFCKRRGATEAKGRQPAAEASFLTSGELDASRQRWLRVTQRLQFRAELEALSRGQPVLRSSPIAALRPMLGRDGLIRVGGRLEHSLLPYDGKHPVILPRRSHLTRLIIRDAHNRILHGGPRLTRGLLSEAYWIIQANSVIRGELRRCI